MQVGIDPRIYASARVNCTQSATWKIFTGGGGISLDAHLLDC